MTSCPICNQPTHFFILEKDRFGQEYEYLRCKKCWFLFDKDLAANKNILQNKVGRIYQKDYFKDIDTGWKLRGDIILKRINRILPVLQFFKGRQKISLLDYGAGKGYIASKINPAFDVFYFDKYGSPEFKGSYKILKEPHKADVVLAVELAEHITNIGEWAALDKLCSLALAFTTEVTNGIAENQLIKWEYLNPDAGHVSIYSFESLYLLAKKYGFFYLFFPSKSFHIFLRNRFLSKFNFVKIEYLIYRFLRKIKHIFKP